MNYGITELRNYGIRIYVALYEGGPRIHALTPLIPLI